MLAADVMPIPQFADRLHPLDEPAHAIGALATFMTEHRDDFSIGGSVAPEGSRGMILPPRED